MFELRPLDKEDIPGINTVVCAAVNAWPLSERVRRLSLPLLQYNEEDIKHYHFTGCFLTACTDTSRTLVAVVAWGVDPHQADTSGMPR